MTLYITVGTRKKNNKVKTSTSNHKRNTGLPAGNATIVDRWGGFVKSLKKSVQGLEKGKTSPSSNTKNNDDEEPAYDEGAFPRR